MKEYIGRARRNLNRYVENHLLGHRLWSYPLKLDNLKRVYKEYPSAALVHLPLIGDITLGVILSDVGLVSGGVTLAVLVNGYLASCYPLIREGYFS